MERFNYTLRKYTDQDYNFVYQTKKNAYKVYVEANWGEWNEEKQKEYFKDFINAYGKDILIIEEYNKRIGFYHGEKLNANEYEVGNICIIPECQGRGIGTKILNDIIKEHKNQNIYLRYFKQNPVVKLYKRLGFEIVEEQAFHYKMVLKTKEQIKNNEK